MVEATQDTDEALMEAFRDGDARAFERLVAKHQRGVYNFLLRSVRDGARTEELLQEVFLRVVRSKQRYERTAKFTTWLYSIARNLCVDESRRARFRNHASLDAERRGKDGDGGQTLLSTLAADEVPTDEAALAGSLRERLAAAVDRLPEDQREVFLLRQLAGLSFREIGETVGIPENTVKSRMRYALEKLRGDLGDLRPASSDAPARGKEAHV
jgi:RNA polymerase sigma-70 factor, ECF subfamily